MKFCFFGAWNRIKKMALNQNQKTVFLRDRLKPVAAHICLLKPHILKKSFAHDSKLYNPIF